MKERSKRGSRGGRGGGRNDSEPSEVDGRGELEELSKSGRGSSHSRVLLGSVV